MKICLNCGAESEGKYCPVCGQETNVKRLEVKTIFHDVTHGILHWENSILKTFRQMLFKPGITAKNYISGLRKSYVKPFSYFIFIQTVYVLLFHAMSDKYFAFVSYTIKSSDDAKEKVEQMQHLVNAYLNYFNYLMPLSFALYFFLFFRKKMNVNYAESLALSLYWIGTTLVFGILFMLLSLIDFRFWNVRFFVNTLFLIFAIVQYTKLPWIKGILKGILVVFLSNITFLIFVGAVLYLFVYLRN